MNYVTELYLDYLNDALIYETIYVNYAADLILREAPADAGIGALTAQIKQLQASKAGVTDPSQLAQINTQIQQLQGQASQVATAAAPSVAPTAAPVKTTPGAETTGTPGMGVKDVSGQSKAMTQPGYGASAKGAQPGPTGTSSADAIAQNKLPADAVAPPSVIPQDIPLATQAQKVAGDVATKAKEVGGDIATKAGEVGKDIVSKGAEVAKDVGGAVSTGLQKVGSDPTTGGAVSSAIQAVGGSPLGLAALGGAAAFGGYKLYKRFMSKSATACRGYSGADKTSCMRSYMDAKRNQAQTRGAGVGAT